MHAFLSCATQWKPCLNFRMEAALRRTSLQFGMNRHRLDSWWAFRQVCAWCVHFLLGLALAWTLWTQDSPIFLPFWLLRRSSNRNLLMFYCGPCEFHKIAVSLPRCIKANYAFVAHGTQWGKDGKSFSGRGQSTSVCLWEMKVPHMGQREGHPVIHKYLIWV